MPTQLRQCPCCADVRDFEAPPCAEGHGPECAERVCLDCGTALLVDPVALPRPRSALSAA